MFFLIIVLALSVSIDSFGIGITYGIRNTSINNSAKIILLITSFVFACISIIFGNLIFAFFPNSIINIISCLLLIFMGIFIIYETYHKFSKKYENKTIDITMQIIKNPINSDLNNSNIIEKNEAIYLALALSLDSICVGISSSTFGLPSLFFPILVPIFQLLFINAGIFLGKKIIISNSISLKFWNFLSGILLIFIGITRIFI